jgi:DtxR family Mn-dependent transcriptional regulator
VAKRSVLSPSLEDYLEAILNVCSEKKVARSKEIGLALRVKGSSVTGALRALSRQGYINYTPYDFVTLTARGEKAAQLIAKRHRILKKFFIEVLQCKPSEAEEVACKTEHVMNPEMIAKLALLSETVRNSKQIRRRITAAFNLLSANGS